VPSIRDENRTGAAVELIASGRTPLMAVGARRVVRFERQDRLARSASHGISPHLPARGTQPGITARGKPPMPILFGLGNQDLPNLRDRIKTMRRVLHGHALHEAELARSGTFSDNRLILFSHAEETIRQAHRELALRSLHSEKNTRSAVEVFEMLKTWQYLQTEHMSESISINTVVNDLEVIITLLEQRATAEGNTVGSFEKTQDKPKFAEPEPKAGGGANDRAAVGSAPISREERVQAFVAAHVGYTLADLRYSANVHKPEFRSWRIGELPDTSVMSQRIEDVLAERRPLRKNPRRQSKD